MKAQLTTIGLAVLLAIPARLTAQTTYDWTGNSNNNWDNSGNWGNASGYPDDPMHHARFDQANFGSGHSTIDLRGGTYDVLNLLMGQCGYLLTFKSSSGGSGKLRINGNMNFTNGNGGAETGPHDFMTNLEVVNASLWTRGDNHYVDIYGVLSGSGTLTATANAAGAGRINSRWRSAGTFNGTLIIDNVYVEIAHPNAFQNADVVVNYDNGFRIDQTAVSGQTINIRSLSGSGLFDFKANNCVSTTDSNTTFSGTLQSTGTNSASRNFTKAGTGILTLTGQVTNFGTLYNTGGGEVEILQGGTWQRIEANSGTVDIRNGATVNLANAGPDVFIVTGGAGAFVRDGADVTLTSNATSPLPRVLQTGGVFNVQGAGSTLTAPQISVGTNGSGSSLLFADDGGSIQVDLLQLGDTAPEKGSFGGAVATGGGTIYADRISLFPRGTLSVNGGRILVDLISVGGSTEAMSLSDPTSGPALIIGATGGSSTFNNLIEDNLGGPGSIDKEGNGTLTLGGANTFSGGVTVSDGTLLATNTSGSATGTGDVSVMNPATLGGTGSCAGAVTVQSGGTVAPGASIGTLTVGNVTFSSGSNLDIEFMLNLLAIESDVLAVNNTATLGGTLDLTSLGGAPLPGNTFVILTANNLVGTFDQVNFPPGQPWSIEYDYNANQVRVGPCFDFDADGVCDADDPCPDDNPDDSDSDGVCDSTDVCPGFDDNLDADTDGVPNGCDACPGFDDTLDADTDGVPDGCDICPGFDDTVDSDNDDVPDGCDVCPNRRPGDMDGDHGVDEDDIMPFVQVLLDPNFGTPDERCAADTNLDSFVNGGDIQLMVEHVIEP